MSAPVTLRLCPSDNAADKKWDAYVHAHPKGTFFHLSGWRQVCEALGHTPLYLMAEQDGVLKGILPLAHVKSALFGNVMLSTPFCTVGGPLADDETILHQLVYKAESLSQEKKVDTFECRFEDNHPMGGHVSELYVNFDKTMEPNMEDNLKAIPRKQRAMVRRGIKANLQGEVIDDLSLFYRIYATSVRNLGTPVFPKRLFAAIQQAFPGQTDIFCVKKDDEPIAAVMSFYYQDKVLPYYGGSLPDARRVAGNDFMYYALMAHALNRGARIFDYGRSKKGTGSYDFKRHWGFEERPLAYQTWLIRAHSLPNINPLNPKYQRMIKTWRKLPLPVANVLGPMIAKSLV